jgi:hypothetical protein
VADALAHEIEIDPATLGDSAHAQGAAPAGPGGAGRAPSLGGRTPSLGGRTPSLGSRAPSQGRLASVLATPRGAQQVDKMTLRSAAQRAPLSARGAAPRDSPISRHARARRSIHLMGARRFAPVGARTLVSGCKARHWCSPSARVQARE